MINRADTVWQSPALVQTYLDGVRGAIPLAKEQIEVMLRLLTARENPMQNFLDIGCGDGVLAAAIFARFPESEGTLIDFSEPMLKAAATRIDHLKNKAGVIQADYAKPDWIFKLGTQQFDAVVSGFSIHHQPDERKRSLYSEIFSLLKPGGSFINVEHVSSPTKWIESVYEEQFIDSLYAFSERKGWNKTRQQLTDEFFNRPDKEANILAPVEAQCEWLRTIGFRDVDCYFKIFELAVFGGRRRA